MLDTGVGIAAMVLVCAAFLYLGLSYVGRNGRAWRTTPCRGITRR